MFAGALVLADEAVLMTKRFVRWLPNVASVLTSIHRRWIHGPFTFGLSDQSDAGLGVPTTVLKRIRAITGRFQARLSILNANSVGVVSRFWAVLANEGRSLRNFVASVCLRVRAGIRRPATGGPSKFASLQTRLTVLYAGLFGLALIVSAIVIYVAISQNAETVVRNELKATGTAFNHVWALKSKQLKESAELTADIAAFTRAVASASDAGARIGG